MQLQSYSLCTIKQIDANLLIKDMIYDHIRKNKKKMSMLLVQFTCIIKDYIHIFSLNYYCLAMVFI